MRSMSLFALSALCLVSACSEDITGPGPVVPDPVADAPLPVDPGVICRDQLTTPVAIHGERFSPVPFDIPNDPKASLPNVELVRARDLDGAAADGAVVLYHGEPGRENAAKLSWQSQQQMTFVVDQSLVIGDQADQMLAEGLYDVRVTNTNGNSDTSESSLAVVDKPTVASIAPGITCLAEDARQFTLTGQTLMRIAGSEGSVTVEGGAAPFALTDYQGCTDIPHPGIDLERCTSASVELPQDGVPVGYAAVTVQNPETAACTSTDDIRLRVVPPPTVSGIDPPAVCTALAGTDQELTITGAGFLEIDGALPSATLDGEAITVSAVGGCEDLETQGHAVQTCTTLTVSVTVPADPANLSPELVITNPAPAGCSSTTSDLFVWVREPSISGASPAAICSGEGGTITIDGTDFSPAARVFLEQDGTVEAEASTVNVIDSTTIEATFDGGLSPGLYDLTVQNAEGCVDTLEDYIEVHPTPLVFFVDPSVAYNGVTIQATIYTTGLQDTAGEVKLVGPGGEEEVLEISSPPDKPNRITAIIPSGLATGEWDVVVTSQLGCVGRLDEGVLITDTLTVAIASIDPAYVWTGRSTPVTIKAPDTLAAGENDFVATPRAYLNPDPADADSVASPLRAVIWTDSKTLTGVVPAGLPPGEYDLIVVNPDATVGLLDKAVTVTADPPPVIDSVVPASFDTNSPFPATIQGANFDATGGVTVTMTCQLPDGTIAAPADVTVNAVTPTSVDATFPSDQFAAGSACIVTLTNADGTSFRFSAVSLKTPAQNLNEWQPAPPMTEPRRALGLAAGRPTTASRYVYAVGGDDGTLAGAKGSVEGSNVDIFGNMGGWAAQRNALPAPRTFAGTTRIGRFVYVVGGHDGTAATDTVWRSQILDPLATPEVADLSVTLLEEGEGTSNLTEGLWIYRVAATFPDTDPSNPGGESLPGEPLVVQLPDIAGIELTLTWQQIPGADGYRVYRTPGPDMGLGDVQLIATVDGGDQTSLADAGAPADDTQTPMPAGSLGVWHDAGVSLTVPREGHGITAAPHPTDPTLAFLIVAGGRDDGGTYLDSYEVAQVAVTEPTAQDETEAQLVSSFTVGSDTIGTARAELGVWLLTSSDAAVVPSNQPWVFFGPGRTGPNGYSDEVIAGPVGNDGDLGTLIPTEGISGSAAGYGAGDANGFLFIFGGAGGDASSGGVSTELCLDASGGQCSGAPGEPPDLKNWNSLGISMSEARVYMGLAQESAFLFVAGGDTGAGVTDSVDTTVQ